MGSLSPRVGIVVLNYNGRGCLPQCLLSLQNLRYQEKFIVVVDNGSQDDSLAQAIEEHPAVTYVRNQENLGFSAGMNRGVEEALRQGAQWVWLFNNDAEADPQALETLIAEASRQPQAGLLSPAIFDPVTTHQWFVQGEIDFFRMRARHITPSRELFAQSSYESEFLTGCALLIRKDVFEKIGLLDERFFLYYEDADFCLRARSVSFQCRVVPAARVFHKEKSRENPQKLYFLVLSGLLFFQKHHSPLQGPYLAAYVTMRRIKNAVDLIFRRANAATVRRAYDQYYHDC